MKITFDNRKVIGSKDVYLHDSYFKQINYDDENKILYIICQDYYYKKLKYITFYNVIYFEMQNGYYWGKSNDESIIEWGLSKDNENLLKFQKLNEKNNGKYLNFEKKYIESSFISSAGNILTIICEEIEYSEREYID